MNVEVLVAQSCLILRPHGLPPARLLCPWDFPSKNTEVGYHFFHQDLPDPGIEPWSLALQVDSLHTGLPGGLNDIFTKFSLQVDSSLMREAFKEMQKPEYKRQ